MPQIQPGSYEYEVAMAIARNPRLMCLDAVNIFELVDGKEVKTFEGFTDKTVSVETFVMELPDEKEQSRGKTFETTKVLRVASSSRPTVPDKHTYVVDEFPVSEARVVKLMTMYLDMNGYFEKEKQFLWGSVVLTKEEGMDYGSKGR